ncbi:MAG: hypothetical protein AAF543_12635 [Pseudomonadota bacterium]
MHRLPGAGPRGSFAALALMLTFFSTVTLADEVTFSTTDGQKITGKVISATLNTLNVHETDGGYSVLPREEIVGVVMDVDGGAVMGSFINWQDGRFTLRVEDRVVTVRDGIVEGELSEVVQPASRDVAPPSEEVEPIEPAAEGDEALSPSVPIEHPTM